jgi:hypothetical protein
MMGQRVRWGTAVVALFVGDLGSQVHLYYAVLKGQVFDPASRMKELGSELQES